MQRVLEFTQNLYRVLSLGSAHKPSIVGPLARGLQAVEPFGIRSGIFWYLYFGTVARWPLTRARQSHRLWWASRFAHCSKAQLHEETRFGPVAQRIEQQPSKLKVAGSSPAGVASKIRLKSAEVGSKGTNSRLGAQSPTLSSPFQKSSPAGRTAASWAA
jgi:hypothetical protein